MIVDPDFPDHWKTRMLVDLLDGDEGGVACILRLWAHCQNRRAHIFPNLSSQALKAICRFPGHANKLESSLLTSGFVRRDGETLIVHQWESYNASLVANWENGKKGGRPSARGQPTENGNPTETHGFPRVNPSITDREDGKGGEKRREEKTLQKNPPAAGADWMGLPAELATEKFRAQWIAYRDYRRERKCKPLGPSSIAEKWRELAAMGSDAACAAIRHSIANGWQGIFPPEHRNGKTPPASRGIELKPEERPKIEVYE